MHISHVPSSRSTVAAVPTESLQPAILDQHTPQAILGGAGFGQCLLEGGQRLGQRWYILADRRQHVAGDIERPVLALDFLRRDDLRPVLHVSEPSHPPNDLLSVRRVEEVLRPALAEDARRVDYDHPPPPPTPLPAAKSHHRRGETGAVEDVGREADHRLDHVLLE